LKSVDLMAALPLEVKNAVYLNSQRSDGPPKEIEKLINIKTKPSLINMAYFYTKKKTESPEFKPI